MHRPPSFRLASLFGSLVQWRCWSNRGGGRRWCACGSACRAACASQAAAPTCERRRPRVGRARLRRNGGTGAGDRRALYDASSGGLVGEGQGRGASARAGHVEYEHRGSRCHGRGGRLVGGHLPSAGDRSRGLLSPTSVRSGRDRRHPHHRERCVICGSGERQPELQRPGGRALLPHDTVCLA